MITEERLNLLHERFKKKAQTNYDNYQSSGVGPEDRLVFS